MHLSRCTWKVNLPIHVVDCKNILGQINSYGNNAHDFLLLVVLIKSILSIMAVLMPFAATSPNQESKGAEITANNKMWPTQKTRG